MYRDSFMKGRLLFCAGVPRLHRRGYGRGYGYGPMFWRSVVAWVGLLALLFGNTVFGGGGLRPIQTVFVIIFENTDWAVIQGSTNASYLNSLLPQSSWCGSRVRSN